MLRKPEKMWGWQQQPGKINEMEKYSNLTDNYYFVPVGAETYGAHGPKGIKLIKQIGKKYRKLPVKN